MSGINKMIKNILAKTRELKKLLAEKELNLDPIDIMARVKEFNGEEWIETDIPTYYRNELEEANALDRRIDDWKEEKYNN